MSEQIGTDHSIDQPLNTTEGDLVGKSDGIIDHYFELIKDPKVDVADKLRMYDLISGSINALIKEKGEAVRDCKLFHKLVASSLSNEQWKEYPMDTPDNDIERFIYGPFLELLSEIETQKNNPH